MARRRAIEPEELFETADRMKAEGKEVTATSLLDALGGGSLRTIYKLLEGWQAQRPPVALRDNVEIPGSVQVGFANAWRLAVAEAERQAQVIKEQAALEVAELQKRFDSVLDEIGKLETEGESDAQEIESLKSNLSEAERALSEARTESASYKAAAEQTQKMVEKLESDLARSQATQSERDTALLEAAEMRGKIKTLEEQNEKLLSIIK